MFDIYRLSSTRELVLDRTDNKSVNVAVYGGLQYGMKYDDVVNDAANYSKSYDSAQIADIGDGQRKRGSFFIDYLKGTKVEAESIVHTIKKHGLDKFKVTPYVGMKGTEASFKALKYSTQKLIHIATHGYFFSEDEREVQEYDLGAHPLDRSGLLFSGAVNKLYGEILPDGVDDGWLTSREISNLDLKDVELVVLSACDTGRGEIDADGVFGLQRGFKMAGVDGLLMSLWKVDDDATCVFMTEYYKMWIGKGYTKREAMVAAREVVRSNKEKGWDSPRYWAAFIMLDGLEKHNTL